MKGLGLAVRAATAGSGQVGGGTLHLCCGEVGAVHLADSLLLLHHNPDLAGKLCVLHRVELMQIVDDLLHLEGGGVCLLVKILD